MTMLLALVAKAAGLGQPAASGVADPLAGNAASVRASRAIWWGVGLAGLASVATAVLLNFLVTSASGAVREILEGAVMLAASAILFYVSYWLISQLEAKRWMDFLKKQARHGLELGGQGTLAVTAFLAVYREGAETSLMYQALLGSEGRTQAGFLGVIAGLALGIVLLTVIAYVIRATSVRLPMRVFFKFSGLFLFVLAIVFAGNGVFELQNAGDPADDKPTLGWAAGCPGRGCIPISGHLGARAVTGRGDPRMVRDSARRSLQAGQPAVRASGWPPSEADTRSGCRHARALGRSDCGRPDTGRRHRGPRCRFESQLSTCREFHVGSGRAESQADRTSRHETTQAPCDQSAAGRLPRVPDRRRNQKNEMLIKAVWLPPVQMEGMEVPTSSNLIHLEADIHATEGNRNGFAKDEFVPYLVVRLHDRGRKWKWKSANRPGTPITGEIMPMVARDGLHYGATIEMPRTAITN